MEKTEENKNGKKINEKKAQLIKLSIPMRELVKIGKADTINDALKKYIYEPKGHTVLKTMKEWNEAGKRIVKGSHALLLWSAPLKGKKHKEQDKANKDTDEEFKFWNVCYLFSNLQVEERK